MKKIVLLALILAANVHAAPCSKEEQNKTDALVDEYPMDDYAVKLSALRTGLCHYVETKKITEDRAGQLLEVEKQKMMLEKFTINQNNQKPTT